MPNHIREIAKQSLVYGVSGVALQAVGVITLPIFARAFSRSDFGVLELATIGSAVALALVDAGFGSAAQRSWFDYTAEQRAERRTVIFTALTVTSGLALAVALTVALARDPASDLLFGTHKTTLMLVVAGTIPAINIAQFLRDVMRLRFRAWQYVLSAVSAAVVAASVGVVCVVALDLGVTGYFVGILTGNLLAVAYGLHVTKPDIGRRFSRFELRRMIAYGLPLVPTAIAVWALWFIDRIMLGKLANLAEVGEYAVANRVAGVLLLAVSGFSLAFSPYFLSLYSEGGAAEKPILARTLTYLTLALSLAGLFLVLFARELIELVAPDFTSSYRAVGPLALGVIFFGIASVAITGISIERRTGYFAFAYGAAAALNIGLNFVLIPPFGMIGAAIATAAAFAVLAGLLYWVSQRLYPAPFEVRKLLTVLVLASLFGLVGLVRFDSLLVALLVKTATLGSFVAALWPAGVLTPAAIQHTRNIARDILQFRAPASEPR